jgi:hypothetical protein
MSVLIPLVNIMCEVSKKMNMLFFVPEANTNENWARKPSHLPLPIGVALTCAPAPDIESNEVIL